MVAQTLECVLPIQSSIANGELGAGAGGAVPTHLMVSRAEKSPKCKVVVKNGGKEVKAEEDSSMQRRASARIQEKQKAAKELLVRRRAEQLRDQVDDGEEMKTKRLCKSSSSEENVVAEDLKSKRQEDIKLGVKSNVDGGEGRVDSGNEVVSVEKSDNAKVKETLRIFNKHYLHFVQEEEQRCRKVEPGQKASKKASKSKKGALPKDSKTKAKQHDMKALSKKGALPKDSKSKTMRPDLKAISKMMENNEILYPEKRVGNIPGIEVGYQFYSRAEMVAVGFHSHWLNGIDYMGQTYAKLSQYSSYQFPVAVAIVLSGVYEDDLDNAEDVIYTGQGGNNLTGDKKQIQDQKMARGNLALKNCIEQCVPVRVVRGHKSASSYCGKVYTYDGLYKVINYWAEEGLSGFTVFKYRLRRVDGQPTLTTNQVQLCF